ncbi:hypothetical protein [Rhizobium sp. P44RR-XXIV]|uniref:hypothetical protein n=1 Tax=Rhizobium sp. P44RR-XXIV TaxID=1921145 RepID=UPI00145A2BCF|nr:hypothetical protein [Rhizobium sp. P44RR-XXIV]
MTNDPAFAGDVTASSPTFLGIFSGGTQSDAYKISSDGLVVVGSADDNAGNAAVFRWTASGGMVNLGTVTGGNFANLAGISADGSVVVGYAGAGRSSQHAFRWTSATGMVDLGTLGGNYSYANAVSADGAVVVGRAFVTGSNQHAFRWTSATDMVDLGTLGGNFSSATAISADGAIVVGNSWTTPGGNQHAFQWTSATGMADLGTLGGNFSNAIAISADGTAVVGQARTDDNNLHAFRWTSSTKMQDLGTLSGGVSSIASLVSADGAVVVGGSTSNIDGTFISHAFRWTSATNMVDLGTLGGLYSVANAMTPGGTVLVGRSTISDSSWHAFRWTSTTGMADLNTLLSNAGVNMTGITLSEANAISANGQYIVGGGTGPTTNGNTQAYIVRYVDATVAPPPPPVVSAGTTDSTPSPVVTGGATTDPTPIAGLTTPASLQSSANEIGKERQTTMGQMHGFADQMLQEGTAFGTPSSVSAFGSVGSASAGLSGHVDLEPFEVMAGIGYASEDYPGASMDGAFIAAAKLRYTHMFDARFGAFGEIGGFYSPDSDYHFSRTYANGAGTAMGSGKASGEQAYGFARIGTLIKLTPDDQFAPSFELGRQTLHTSSYNEVLSSVNPFDASMPASSSTMDLFKLRGQWVHDFTSKIEGSVWGAWAHGFNYHDGSQLNVGGLGSLSPQTSGSLDWAEYGVRVDYKLTEKMKVAAFVNGVAGGDVGSRAHVGADVSLHF